MPVYMKSSDQADGANCRAEFDRHIGAMRRKDAPPDFKTNRSQGASAKEIEGQDGELTYSCATGTGTVART